MDAFTTVIVAIDTIEVEIPADFEGTGSGGTQPSCIVA